MIDAVVLTEQSAASLMQWAFLDAMAPELLGLRTQLRGAAEALAARTKKGGCTKCLRSKYQKWGKVWLVRVNTVINASQDTRMVVEDFLATQTAVRP